MKKEQVLAVYHSNKMVGRALEQVCILFNGTCEREIYSDHHKLMDDIQSGRVGYLVEIEDSRLASGLLGAWNHDYRQDFEKKMETVLFPPHERLSVIDSVVQLMLINEFLNKDTSMTWKESVGDISFEKHHSVIAVDDNKNVLGEYEKFFDGCPYLSLNCINTSDLTLGECVEKIRILVQNTDVVTVILLDEQMPNFKGQALEAQLRRENLNVAMISTTSGMVPYASTLPHFSQKHGLTGNRVAGGRLLQMIRESA